MRARKGITILATGVAAAALAGAAGATSTGTDNRDGPLTATFSARGHHPNCKQKWPVTVTARYNGRPAHATAYYQFLLYQSQQLVAKQYPFGGTRRNPHNRVYRFYGGFTDNTFGPFGARAIGYKIIVRAVVQDGRYTVYPGTWVEVVRASGCRP